MTKKFLGFLGIAVCLLPLSAQDRDVLDRFKSFDTDKDGKVTRTEAGAAWARYERMDIDGNGSVTADEVRSFFTRQERPGSVPASFTIASFKKDRDEIKYGWFAPTALPRNVKAPLVLCLHGAGGSTLAAQVLATPRLQAKYPCFVMAPGCGKKEAWANTDVLLRQREHERLPLVVEAIQTLLNKEAIDPNRIYVTGQSMGGVGTWAALVRYADVFAAGVPVCGAWNPKDAAKLAKTPLWAFHGANDAAVPVKWSREMIDAINKVGNKSKYTEYPDAGHGIWSQTYNTDELWEWLFAQQINRSQ